MSHPHPTRTMRVSEKTEIADRVVQLTLTPADAEPLPRWEPGAHIDLILPNGITRQYSLCGRPSEREWRVAVLRELDGRGGSEHIHAALERGASIEIAGPRNHFSLEDAEEYLFIGGGIGITPLLPMIDQVARAGKPWRLVYGGRSRASMPYLQELSELHPAHIDAWPQDERGIIDLDAVLGDAPHGRAVYSCGPEPMLAAITQHCEDWPDEAVHMERFAPIAVAGTADESFEVEIASSGKVYDIPADRSILEVLRDGGEEVDWSCEEGTCGTCEVRILDGVAEHRDSVLTTAEQESQETMMICVSRARCRLKIDL